MWFVGLANYKSVVTDAQFYWLLQRTTTGAIK